MPMTPQKENKEFEIHEAEIERVLAEIDGLMADYELTISSDADRQCYDAAVAAWEKY